MSGFVSCQSKNPCSKNASESRVNNDEWTSKVVCARVEKSIPDGGPKAICNVDIETLLSPHLDARIVAYEEFRQKFFKMQLFTILFYHAYVILEVEGGISICTQKYNDKLELMLGPSEPLRSFAWQYIESDKRLTSIPQGKVEAKQLVFVRDLLKWINGPMAMVWKKYSLLTANCQHYAQNLQDFLQDPAKAQQLTEDIEIVLPAVRSDGLKLQHASAKLQRNPQVVLAAAKSNSAALVFAADSLKCNPEFIIKLKCEGFDARQLKDARFRAGSLKDAGFTLPELKRAGFAASDLKGAGFDARQLKGAGFRARDLKA